MTTKFARCPALCFNVSLLLQSGRTCWPRSLERRGHAVRVGIVLRPSFSSRNGGGVPSSKPTIFDCLFVFFYAMDHFY